MMASSTTSPRAIASPAITIVFMVFAGKSLHVRLALPFQTGLLEADPEGIHRIVTALLDNAKKYTPAGGTIAISLLDDPQSFELQISDTGCGIPQESLARIFDRFYRVDSSRDQQTGGCGLGLAIAQQIAHAHNGRIAASSIPGEGTTMHLSLPKNSISG
jgi:signal transduction histidine kinase